MRTFSREKKMDIKKLETLKAKTERRIDFLQRNLMKLNQTIATLRKEFEEKEKENALRTAIQ